MKSNDIVNKILVADREVLSQFGLECYNAGFHEALSLCDKILGWLTMQPDTKRQKEQRKWVKNLIRSECKAINIDPPKWLDDCKDE